MTLFDYGLLPIEVENLLTHHAESIRGLVKLTKDAMLEIGQMLNECKAVLPYGQFLPWVEAEFTDQLGWSLATAENWMRLAENRKVCEFPLSPSALYQLAGAPDDAIETIQAMIDSGEQVTVRQVAATVTESRFRAKITESVAAMLSVRPSEVRGREKVALGLLQELDNSLQDSRLRSAAIELMKQHGDKLRAWAEIQDTKEEILAQAGVSWEERQTKPTGTISAQLQEGEGNHRLIVWIPAGSVSRAVTIATFPDVDDPVALSWQSAVIESACRRVNAKLDKYEEL